MAVYRKPAPPSRASSCVHCSMKSPTTAPDICSQYCVMPFSFAPLPGSAYQWVSAMCLPSGNCPPSEAFHGAAMNALAGSRSEP
jgi:hypothetical protein